MAKPASSGPWSDGRVREHLEQTVIPVRLAATAPSGWPVVLSLWYLYRDGALWCATHRDAKILRVLEAHPRCAFEVAADDPPYKGVRGRAEVTLEAGRGGEILELLLERYLGGTESELARWLLSRSEHEVALRLDPVQLSSWDFTRRMSA